MLLCDRLKQLREQKGLLQQDMADLLGISKSAYGFYEQGKRRPDLDTLAALADYFHTTVDHLLGREPVRSSRGDIAHAAPATVPVPILGVIRAGPDGFLQEEFRGNVMTESHLLSLAPHFWLEVRGDSMINFSINEGDLVLISKEPCTQSGKICAVMVDHTEATLKRVRFERGGLVLEAGNPNYPSRFFSQEQVEAGEVQIIGISKQIRRELN